MVIPEVYICAGIPITPIAEKNEATMDINIGNHGIDLLPSKYSLVEPVFCRLHVKKIPMKLDKSNVVANIV